MALANPQDDECEHGRGEVWDADWALLEPLLRFLQQQIVAVALRGGYTAGAERRVKDSAHGGAVAKVALQIPFIPDLAPPSPVVGTGDSLRRARPCRELPRHGPTLLHEKSENNLQSKLHLPRTCGSRRNDSSAGADRRSERTRRRRGENFVPRSILRTAP